MSEKRFKLRLSKLGNGMITNTQKREDLYFDKEFLDATLPKATEWLNELADENEQLKQSFTMYYNLFVEFQKQMKGVKKVSDLDSKDFEDLIELSKGNVFDGEDGYIDCKLISIEKLE